MEDIVNKLADQFVLIKESNSSKLSFKNIKNGLIFQYINGGEYIKGFSNKEEIHALKLVDNLPFDPSVMRPVKKVYIKPFLVTRTPILNHEAKKILRDSYYDKYSDNDYVPAYLKRDAAINIAQAVNYRLPREEEWEYLCRSGTNSLFVFGNDLPPDDEMERWLDCDFSDLTKLNANPFGLYGMFNPEWCEDEFTCNYNHDAPKIEGSYVVRGGGAYFWPWQEDEWVWCMSAMRYPSKELIDEECCLRLVYDLKPT